MTTSQLRCFISPVRQGGRDLQKLTDQQRANIISRLADLLREKEEEILTANKKDIALAEDTLSPSLLSRLRLSSAKLQTLADGISAIAEVSILIYAYMHTYVHTYTNTECTFAYTRSHVHTHRSKNHKYFPYIWMKSSEPRNFSLAQLMLFVVYYCTFGWILHTSFA